MIGGPALFSVWLDWVVFGGAALVVITTFVWAIHAWRALPSRKPSRQIASHRLVAVGPDAVVARPIRRLAPARPSTVDEIKAEQVFTTAIGQFDGYCAYRKILWALSAYNELAPAELKITQRDVRDLLRDYVYQGDDVKTIRLSAGNYVLVQESERKNRLVTMDHFERCYLVADEEE